MISREILDHEAHSTSENLIHPKCLENSKPPKQHRRVPTVIADKLATTKSLIASDEIASVIKVNVVRVLW